jgi:hypothetical protein
MKEKPVDISIGRKQQESTFQKRRKERVQEAETKTLITNPNQSASSKTAEPLEIKTEPKNQSNSNKGNQNNKDRPNNNNNKNRASSSSFNKYVDEDLDGLGPVPSQPISSVITSANIIDKKRPRVQNRNLESPR